ncbi:hypothetical protein Tco_1298388, partial [Tanacetum coccineum]
TDISIITRKQSKTEKHEHEKQKSTKEGRDAKPKPGKVKKSKLWSTSSQPWVKSVISRAPIGSLKQGCHVAMKKAQGVTGFYSIITHTTSTSCHIKRMTAWQSVARED